MMLYEMLYLLYEMLYLFGRGFNLDFETKIYDIRQELSKVHYFRNEHKLLCFPNFGLFLGSQFCEEKSTV